MRVVLDKGQQESPSSKTQGPRVVELLEGGVQVRLGSCRGGRFTVHQKALLVDRSYAALGSGNATGNSRDRCYEFGIGTSDVGVVASLHSKLEELWEAGSALTLEAAQKAKRRWSTRA